MGLKVIIGDDLTGAMDAGLQLLDRGYSVKVILNAEHIKNPDCDIIILGTESRNISKDDAFTKTVKVINEIKMHAAVLVYKKIDSTMRGNIGIELSAIIDSGICDMIMVCPALPYNKRTVKEGNHYLGGKLLTESDLANDPFSPVKSSYVPDIIKSQSEMDIKLLKLDEIRKGYRNVIDKLNGFYKEGARIIAADAETDMDLENLASAVDKSKHRILSCGSAGLLPKIFKKKISVEKGGGITYGENKNPVLIISGSPASSSKEQIKQAESNGIATIRLDIGRLKNGKAAINKEKHRTENEITNMLKEGRSVVLDGAGESKSSLHKTLRENMEELVSEGDIIKDTLGQIVLNVLRRIKISGLVVFGGDTSYSLCCMMGADGIEIMGEAEPYVPSGRIFGGDYDGLPIITKAGGFGTKDIVENSINFLER